MKRITKSVLWGGLAFTLAIGLAPAQQINEIIRGVVNGTPSDIFSCGAGNIPCDLGYRMYCDLHPGDVSGSANPVDGLPKFGKAGRYLGDAQITGNYPLCSNEPAGQNWYIIWDGQLDGGTAAHTGWYGAQAQKVFHNEIGNPLSFNCLPVTAAVACFAALDDLGQFNDTILRDGTPLNHIGGISPVPVPQFEARIDSIAAVFESAANKTVLDGANDPITGIELWTLPDNAGTTDGDWAALAADWDATPRISGAEPLAVLTSIATEFKMLRGSTFLADDKNFMLATRLTYAGGHQSFISANSGLFNELQDLEFVEDDEGGGGLSGSSAGGADAAAIINIERIGFSVRKDDFGKEFLIILLDIEGDPAGQVLTAKAKYAITINTPGGIANMQVRANALAASKTRGGPTVLRFNTNFDNTGDADGLLSANSTFDEASDRGWIMFGVPLSELVDAFNGGSIAGPPGTRVVTFSGSSRVPGAIDTFPNDGGEISFTF
jgi:hypothetical protein